MLTRIRHVDRCDQLDAQRNGIAEYRSNTPCDGFFRDPSRAIIAHDIHGDGIIRLLCDTESTYSGQGAQLVDDGQSMTDVAVGKTQKIGGATADHIHQWKTPPARASPD